MEPEAIIYIFLIGILATIAMDVWQFLLYALVKIPRPDWAALGRWVLGMSDLGLVQLSLTSLPKRNNEAFLGWCLHYLVGISYAAFYVYMLSMLHFSALGLALGLAVLSLLIPWCIVMPCTGYGFFASAAPKPMLVRIYNLMTHLLFFFALFLAARFFLPGLF